MEKCKRKQQTPDKKFAAISPERYDNISNEPHIRPTGIDEAIAIAKDNPEFEFVPAASVEVRPIKMKEDQTNFVYPAGGRT
jgi:hypothetical protein